MKSITKQQIDELTLDQLKQIVFCTNDGQGDTSVDSVYELRGWHVSDDGYSLNDPEGDPNNKLVSNSELLDILYSDTRINLNFAEKNGNMTTCIWIENNSFEKIRFI